MTGTFRLRSHAPSRQRSRHGSSRSLRRLVLLSRLLPVAVQSVLVITAILTRSWVLVLMSAASLAMSSATALQSLLMERDSGNDDSDCPSSSEEAQQPSVGLASGILDRRASVSIEDAASCEIPTAALAGVLAEDARPRMPSTAKGPHGPGTSEPHRAESEGLMLWYRCFRSWMTAAPQEDGASAMSRGQQEQHRHDRLEAPIGTDASGSAVRLDLIASGPHALVAGTTGSGKSALLESWCGALALTYPPERLNFVFLDFKGGATFLRLRGLPHTVGCVSDLSLARARRALLGLEQEMHRREELLAGCGVPSIDRLRTPLPRLIVVVDEFNALRTSLPDYLPRLARIASQGRSLGIHLILATQSPSAEVPRAMQANIGTSICLRVRDPLQSEDMTGTRAAAFLPSARPGTAVLEAGDGPRLFRACMPAEQAAEACGLAQRFRTAIGQQRPKARELFTDPLPRRCVLSKSATMEGDAMEAAGTDDALPCADWRLCIGLADDGVRVGQAWICLKAGNVAICGPPGRGKTIFCELMRCLIERQIQQPLRKAAMPVSVQDDADRLLDPLASGPEAQRLQDDLADPAKRTVYAVRDPKLVRFPAQCTTRIYFPTGDASADMLAGIPSSAMSLWERTDLTTPGRALLADSSGWTTIQIACPTDSSEAGRTGAMDARGTISGRQRCSPRAG